MLRNCSGVGECFAVFDKEKTGKLYPKQFQTAMSRLGVNLSTLEVEVFFTRWDKDGDGYLEQKEFTQMVPVDMIGDKLISICTKKSATESVANIYRWFDID